MSLIELTMTGMILFISSILLKGTKRIALFDITSFYVVVRLYGFGSFFIFFLIAFNYFLQTSKFKTKLSLLIAPTLIILTLMKLLKLLDGNYMIPIGFSFFTLQQIGFLVEANLSHPRTLKGLREYFRWSVPFFSFATGPILRWKNLNQCRSFFIWNSNSIRYGFLLISIGLFKKYVIGDSINQLTTMLYNDKNIQSSDVLIPFLLNKYEIYANFSGFSDVAIGLSRIYGIDLPENFNHPFKVSNIVEFWRRWHISLSTWFRDFVFYPLCASNLGFGLWWRVALTYLALAFWHNVNLNFLIYGLLQVILIYFSYKFGIKLTKKIEQVKIMPLRLLLKLADWILFYVFIISIPSLLFRSDSLTSFFFILKKILNTNSLNIIPYINSNFFILLKIFFAMSFLLIVERALIGFNSKERKGFKIFRFSILLMSILLFTFVLIHPNSASFVYAVF